MKTVAVLVGSLRKESINRQFALALAKLAQGRLAFSFAEVGDLPLYNDDLWSRAPASVLRLKRQVEAANAVLFVTPEYNRSFSPALKNAIDWGTRPWGENSWAGKPGAVIGATPGATGTATAQNALRGLLSVVEIVPMAQPEIYLTLKPGSFDPEGDVSDADLRALLDLWVDRFVAWIDRVSPRP